MKHISTIMRNPAMKRAIMRRVYYSYALSIFGNVLFLHGMFLSIAVFLLAKWLHIASIIDNFLSVPVGKVPEYVMSSFFGAISHGELLTAIVLLASCFVAFSSARHLAQTISVRVRHQEAW